MIIRIRKRSKEIRKFNKSFLLDKQVYIDKQLEKKGKTRKQDTEGQLNGRKT